MLSDGHSVLDSSKATTEKSRQDNPCKQTISIPVGSGVHVVVGLRGNPLPHLPQHWQGLLKTHNQLGETEKLEKQKSQHCLAQLQRGMLLIISIMKVSLCRKNICGLSSFKRTQRSSRIASTEYHWFTESISNLIKLLIHSFNLIMFY